jgi:hypothetical protein
MHEWLDVAGPEEPLRGFLLGWAVGRGLPLPELERRVRWAADWRIHPETDAGWIARVRGSSQELVVHADLLPDLLLAFRRSGRFEVRAVHRVARARFELDFELFSRADSATLRGILAGLPTGQLTVDLEAEEHVDPEAAGLELHGSLHDYVHRGRGAIYGDVDAVLDTHERLRQVERVRTRDVQLEFAA